MESDIGYEPAACLCVCARAVYAVNHHLPTTLRVVVQRLQLWLTGQAAWCATLYTDNVIPTASEPEDYTPHCCLDFLGHPLAHPRQFCVCARARVCVHVRDWMEAPNPD
uniref:Uncharacterized protein n=1 Tax=Eutreptiella gymnastica TaxID=73025 RepID=A0A7S4D0N4_9EUGL